MYRIRRWKRWWYAECHLIEPYWYANGVGATVWRYYRLSIKYEHL